MRSKIDACEEFPAIPGELPARLSAAQVAAVLGFKKHDILALTDARLLKPLGDPDPYSSRYFAAVEICALKEDRNWLSRATNLIYGRWKSKNRRDDLPPTAADLSTPFALSRKG